MSLVTYFLIALYQLKQKNPSKAGFLYPEIEEQMKENVPTVTTQEMQAAFLGDTNPIKLGFCKVFSGDNKFVYIPIFHFEEAVTPNHIYNQEVSVPTEMTRNHFAKYYPEAYQDYLKAIDAIFKLAAALEGIEKKMTFKLQSPQLEQDLLRLAPKFTVNSSITGGILTINCKEVWPSIHISDQENITLFSMQQILQIICNHILLSRQNVYDYSVLVRGILASNNPPQKNHKNVVMSSLSAFNRKLIALGYCYQNTDHLLNVSNGTSGDAQYSLELNKNFCKSDFSGETDNLESFHALAISTLKETYQLAQSERFDYASVKNKVSIFLKSSTIERNTCILMALYNMTNRGYFRSRYTVDEIIIALDNDFKCLREYKFFENEYRALAAKLIEFKYYKYKKSIQGEITFKIDLIRKFNAEDFSVQTYQGQNTSELFGTLYSKHVHFNANVKISIRLVRYIYQFAIDAQVFSLSEMDIKNIISKGFEFTKPEQYDVLYNNTVKNFVQILSRVEDKYCFVFDDKACNYIERLCTDLLPYYKNLREKHSEWEKKSQRTQSVTDVNHVLAALAESTQPMLSTLGTNETLQPASLPLPPQVTLSPAVTTPSLLQFALPAVSTPLPLQVAPPAVSAPMPLQFTAPAVTTPSTSQTLLPPIPVVGSYQNGNGHSMAKAMGELSELISSRKKAKPNPNPVVGSQGLLPENTGNSNGTSLTNK